jgi:hypothetical protein
VCRVVDASESGKCLVRNREPAPLITVSDSACPCIQAAESALHRDFHTIWQPERGIRSITLDSQQEMKSNMPVDTELQLEVGPQTLSTLISKTESFSIF